MKRVIKEYVLRNGSKTISVPEGSYILDKVVRGNRVFLSLLVDDDIERTANIEVVMVGRGEIDHLVTSKHTPLGAVQLPSNIAYLFWRVIESSVELEDLDESEDDA